MDRCIVVNDYTIDNYNLICECKPAPEGTPVGAYLSDIKRGRVYKKVYLNTDEPDGLYRLSAKLNAPELKCGTWHLIFVFEDGTESMASFREEVNPYKNGRMIELSRDKLVFDPEGKIHYMGAIDKDSNFSVRKWRHKSDVVKKEPVAVIDFFADKLHVEFDIMFAKRERIRQAEVWIWSKALNYVQRADIDLAELKKGVVNFNLSSYIDIYNSGMSGRLWEVFLVYNSRGIYHVSRLEMRDPDQTDKKNVFYSDLDEEDRYVVSYPIREGGRKEYDWVYQLYFNYHAELCAKVVPRDQMYINMYRAKIKSFRQRRGHLKMTICYKRKEFNNHRLILRYCPEDPEGYAEEYEFNIVKKRKDESGRIVEYCLDYPKVDWKPLRYELIVKCEKAGYEYEFKVMGRDDRFYKNLSKVYRNAYLTKDNTYVFISENLGHKIVFECRKRNEYDALKYRINEKAASFVYYLCRIFNSDKKKYLMFYEKFCTTAQDNSYYMFEYFMQNEHDERVKPVYVIEKRQQKYRELKSLYDKNVVAFMSFKHLLYVQLAVMFVSTDSKRHCYRWRTGSTRILRMLNDKKFVFLQHGVIGLKKVDYIYGKQYANKADIFVASSEYEKKLINRWFGYDDNEIIVTGLARWDKLVSVPEEPPVIFYMPTWRNWIFEVDDEEAFKATDYYREYSGMLESKELAQILKTNNVRLVFCMHPKFRQFYDCMKSSCENITIFDYEVCNINDMLMSCSLFITDYSSAAWDVYYMEKPVIFYQFDADKYNEYQGAYVNLEKNLFGKRVTDYNTFLSELKKCIDNGFAYDPSDDKIMQDYIPIKNVEHRKLIFDEIMKHI